MPRTKGPEKSTIELQLPLELRAKLDLLLYSPAEERVPLGAYSKFFEQLLRDRFSLADDFK